MQNGSYRVTSAYDSCVEQKCAALKTTHQDSLYHNIFQLSIRQRGDRISEIRFRHIEELLDVQNIKNTDSKGVHF